MFRNSILAGIYISLAGLAFLKLGGILGAIIFSFGLLGVIQTESSLYTGKIYTEENILKLGKILGGNILGCLFIGILTRISFPELISTAENIIATRTNDTFFGCLVKGSLCGVIMTTAVMGSKKNNWWPLLFGIPCFILSGFYHSVADIYYFTVSPSLCYLGKWIMIVIGNWFGGKLFFLWTEK